MCLAVLVLVPVLLVTLYRDAAPPATPLMLLRLAEGYGIDKSWRPLDEISPFLIRTVITAEDPEFCHHRGFEPSSMPSSMTAAWQRYQSLRERVARPGTISMQTADNVFLLSGPGWLRRRLSEGFTFLIELAWSKRRILEIYLNVVEWGRGIYGAEAAAQHYFHVSADRLSPHQAVRLAGILADPLAEEGDGEALAARERLISDHIVGVPVWDPLPCGETLR
ncbi:MAG: monofunctional biosynthetic peptidoglycan transglycosylase [Thiohalocapsa sp.]